MSNVVIVSGTPGTGKTKIAKIIAKKIKAKYIDINKLIKKNKLSSGYNKKLKTNLVKINKLIPVLVKIIKKRKGNLVIDSHLSHYIPSKYVNKCFVTTCDLKVLKKRLEKRGYNKAKIRENLNSEIFGVCMLDAFSNKHKVRIVDTTKGIKNLNVKKLLK